MTTATRTVECEVCDALIAYTYDVDDQWNGIDAQADAMTAHFDIVHEVVVARDGHNGIWLVSLFPQDVHDLLGTPVPDEIREAIDTYDASSVLSDAPMPSDEDLGDAMQMLVDYADGELERALSDAGYIADHDDGYVIRKV